MDTPQPLAAIALRGVGPSGPEATVAADAMPAETWVSAVRVAEVLGISRQAVDQRARAGALVSRVVRRPGGGRRIEIAAASLPEDARARILDRSTGEACLAPTETTAIARRVLVPQIVPTDEEIWGAARDVDRAEAARRQGILNAADAYAAVHDPAGEARAATLLDFVKYWNMTHGGADGTHGTDGTDGTMGEGQRLSRSTIYRWRDLLKQRGRIGLLPAYTTGSDGPQIPEEIRERFNRAWLTQRKLSVSLAREVVVGELSLAGSPLAAAVPSVATFRRYAKTLPRAVVCAGREGWEAYRNRHEAHLERDYSQIPVMDIAVSDHCEFDVWVRGANGKPFRPWVTLWLDVRSRLWLGWTIHAGPCLDTVLSSLASAILRYGIPSSLYSDNGREYSAHALSGRSRRWKVDLDEARIKTLTEHLQVAWSFSIPNNPQSRGMIERAFGVMHDRFDRLWPTYCGRNPEHRPEELAAIIAAGTDIPTLEQFAAAFTRWVHEDQNVRPQEGDGMDGQSAAAVFAAAEYVKRTTTADELRLLFMRSATPVTIQRNGLWAFDRWYRSDPLALRQGEQVYYRYAQEDISELYVYTLRDEYLCTVQRKELSGGTSADHRAMTLERKRQKKLVRAFMETRESLAAAPDQLSSIIAARQAVEGGRGDAGTRGGGDERPDRPRDVIQPVHTPFYNASKAIQAEAEGRDHRAAAKRRADQAAQKVLDQIRREATEKNRGQRPEVGGQGERGTDTQGDLLSRIYERQKAQSS